MNKIRSTYTDQVALFGLENPMDLVQLFGSPLYVYNEQILRQRCQDLLGLSSHPGFRVNYSAKANANPALLKIIREQGCMVDAMSPAELQLDLRAGFDKSNILYISNNISKMEMQNALAHGLLISVDSLAQLERLGQINQGGQVMIRFNPGIGAGHSQKVITGGKLTKFGVNLEDLDQVLALLEQYDLQLTGINQHIGSLFMDGASYVDAMQVLLDFAAHLLTLPRCQQLGIIDFGGGFGIPYHKYELEARLDLAALGQLLDSAIRDWSTAHNYQGLFLIEPGRYIAAESSLLLGTVQAIKDNAGTRFVGTDLGFNVMMRPVLYDSFHDLEIYRADQAKGLAELEQTIVGNICESGDIIAAKRVLPEIRQDDIIAVLDTGAYGFAMSSNYNARQRPAEVLIGANGKARLIRRRETIEDLLRTLVD